MAQGLRGLPRRGLWLLLAHHLFAVTACQDADFGTLAQEHCLARFESDMEAVGEPLWCDWAKTIGPEISHFSKEPWFLLSEDGV